MRIIPVMIAVLMISGCAAQKKVAQFNAVPPCFPDGGVLAIETEKDLPPEVIQNFPPVVAFPLEAIPEAKAAGLKGTVKFSLPALKVLGTVCREYERIKAEK